MTILVVVVGGWGFCQYSILYPESTFDIWHVVYGLTLAYFQMFGELKLDSVIHPIPFDMPEEEGWCTDDEELYSNYTKLRCPDKNINWVIYFGLMIFLVLTNLLLFNLLIAIFSNTFQKIEGASILNK